LETKYAGRRVLARPNATGANGSAVIFCSQRVSHPKKRREQELREQRIPADSSVKVAFGDTRDHGNRLKRAKAAGVFDENSPHM
jgi:hypothetical protein